MGMSKLPLTDHAKLRRRQRGITEHQIEETLDSPDTIYPAGDYTVHRRGDIKVVTNRQGAIVTVARRTDAA
jgi:Cu2+-containing amine oxidase